MLLDFKDHPKRADAEPRAQLFAGRQGRAQEEEARGAAEGADSASHDSRHRRDVVSVTASARWRAGPRLSRATHGEFTQESNDDDDTDAYGHKRKRLPPGHPNARGAYRKWPIDEGVTAVAIPKLQAHLKTLPGGDAMAKKVEGWGAFRKGGRYDTYYVDRDARKCYRTKPEIVRALKAEASA